MSQNNENDIPGRIFENKGLWSFMLLMGTNAEIDALSSFFEQEWGYEANGHAWQAVVQTFMATYHSKLTATLRYDSEADMLCVRCADVEPLKIIAQFFRKMLLNPEELREVLQSTKPD